MIRMMWIVEVSDEVFGLFNEESGSEMENEASSVVELSAGDSIKDIRRSLAPGKPMVDKEKTETPPLAHSQALTVPKNTRPPCLLNNPIGLFLALTRT